VRKKVFFCFVFSRPGNAFATALPRVKIAFHTLVVDSLIGCALVAHLLRRQRALLAMVASLFAIGGLRVGNQGFRDNVTTQEFENLCQCVNVM
jgi:hypothetical protein